MPKKHKQKLTKNEKIIITSVVFGVIIFMGLLYQFPNFRNVFTESIPNGMIETTHIISDGLSQFFSDLYKDSNLMTAYSTYFIIYGTIITMTILFYLYNTDATLFSTKTFVSTTSIAFMFFIFALLIKVMFFTSTNITGINALTNTQIITYAFAIMVLTIIVYYMNKYMSTPQLLLVSDIFMIFVLLGLTVLLAMFFMIFNNSLKLMTGWSGFFIYLLFYIPCLLIRLIEYIKAELKVTTNTVFILFLLEIMFILSYLYLPKLLNLYLRKGGIALLEGNRFLDKKYTLTTGSKLRVKDKQADLTSGAEVKTKSPDQNFSISMWVYINIQPPSDVAYAKERNIFKYGNERSNITSKKPQIVYNYDSTNNKLKKFKIYFTNETSTTSPNSKNYYEFSMLEQKWNNIVINYNSNVVDLFINGNLETSFAYAPNFNIPTYQVDDTIKIGSNNGLYGSICNIRYYHHPLSKSEIVNQYNLLVFKNPPINTI
jgi:hypothetical protein